MYQIHHLCISLPNLNLCCSCSVTKSCLTLCDPKDCSPADSSVLHSFPGFTQIYWVSDAIIWWSVSPSDHKHLEGRICLWVCLNIPSSAPHSKPSTNIVVMNESAGRGLTRPAHQVQALGEKAPLRAMFCWVPPGWGQGTVTRWTRQWSENPFSVVQAYVTWSRTFLAV